jgi:putative toxin-antitoxin system antitoxin component (TIGR02293 family)
LRTEDNLPLGKWHNGYMATLDTPFVSSLRLDLEAVEAGVPVATMDSFVAASGMKQKDVLEVVIPLRTLKHRKARKEPLTLDESDKLVRLIKVYDLAVQVFGEKEKAVYWLGEPKRRFEGRTPLQMMRTGLGTGMVEEMLVQIDEGMFV